LGGYDDVARHYQRVVSINWHPFPETPLNFIDEQKASFIYPIQQCLLDFSFRKQFSCLANWWHQVGELGIRIVQSKLGIPPRIACGCERITGHSLPGRLQDMPLIAWVRTGSGDANGKIQVQCLPFAIVSMCRNVSQDTRQLGEL
jgi:hypothetical protein